MADFINTIDELGDDVVADSIIDRTITEFKDDTLTVIGKYAFYKCNVLETVDLPAVPVVNENAFGLCESLVTANIPNVTTIENYGFMGCSSLPALNLPKVTKIGLQAFYNCTALSNVDLPNATDIAQQAFRNCTALTNVNMPSVTSIFQETFFDDSNLIEINIPSVSSVGYRAFRNCTALPKVDLPSATSIADESFYGCSNMTALILRNTGTVCSLAATLAMNVTPITSGAGYIYVPGDLIDTYKSAANWSTYAEQFRGIIDDEDALQGIIDGTLVNYENNSITSIPSHALYNYQKLETVKLPNVTELGKKAFYGCTALTEVDMPNLVSSGTYADCFKNCTSLVKVNLPKAQRLTNNIFSNCTSLKSIYLPEFVSVPSGDYGGGHFGGCTSLETAILPKLVSLYSSIFSDCKSLQYVDTSSVESIGNWAFQRCGSLKAVVLRNESVIASLTSSNYVFYGTPLSGVHIYVPSALIPAYQADTNWSVICTEYPGIFRALEDYTVDGTITGEFKLYAESISLNASELTFNSQNSQTLIVSGDFGVIDTIVWESSNTDVATVNNGVVTPLYDGTATITARNGNCVATCIVTVSGLGEKPTTLYSLPRQTTFNGTSDYIDTGIKLFDTPKSFTIVCTAEFNKLGSNKCLFHCMNEAAPYPGVSMDGNSGARVCYTGTSSLVTSISPASSVKTIVLRYVDGVLDAIKYFDTGGKLNNVNVNANAKYTTVTQNLILGAYQQTNGAKGRYYAGTIYNFDVYAFAMSDDEIAALS